MKLQRKVCKQSELQVFECLFKIRISRMTTTLELTSTRKKLQNVLGDAHSIYFNHLKNWFKKRISKENFDAEARKILPKEHSHLHNEFLLAILNKCQTLANFTPNMMSSTSCNLLPVTPRNDSMGSDRLKKGKIKRKSKANKAQFDQRFQPAGSPEDIVSDEGEIHEEEKNLKFCYREPILPDTSMLHGRMLVMAWEEGLEGVDDQSIELMVLATKALLKKMITALIMKRSGFRVRDGRFPHSFGVKRPNPWLRNSQNKLTGCDVSEVSEVIDHVQFGVGGDVETVAPVPKFIVHDAEQRAAFEFSCGLSQSELEVQKHPIDLFDLLQVLKERKSLIPCHSVYAVNLHRVISRLHHLGHDEI